MNKQSWALLAVLGITVLVVTLIVVGIQGGAFGGGYASNGERIYFTATNDGGSRITYRGGPAFGDMMMGSQYACVSCHGLDARGGVHTIMMQVMDAPDIRWLALAGEVEGINQTGDEHDDGHADVHTEYDLESFRLAVVEGKHPNGERMSNDMPRWIVNDGDLADLAAFLKSPAILEEKENELFPGNFGVGSWWMIFPIIGVIFMFFVMGRMGFMGQRRDSRMQRDESAQSETPLEILNKRYAKGEISKEEYEQIKNSL